MRIQLEQQVQSQLGVYHPAVTVFQHRALGVPGPIIGVEDSGEEGIKHLFFIYVPICETANDNLHTDDVHELRGDKASYLCAVCLDVYFNPYMCYPCHHIFCEPCLRMLAKDNPASTPCPLCHTTIARVFFQTELNNSTKSFFPAEYLKLKESFQKSNSAKWPLPSCKKAFRVIEGGFQRHSDTVKRRHFPHAAHRMDYMDFEDDSRGWWFDMDMVIIYIYSVNWVIGFIVFCFLCYFFFPF
ncbi:E3 ubiquitin-protein ligase RNF180-like [Phoenicopterus ruber ruber]